MTPLPKPSLSRRQQDALDLLAACERKTDPWGVVTSSATCRIDGQAWVHWRTANALEALGLVELSGTIWEDVMVKLTDVGRGRSRA